MYDAAGVVGALDSVVDTAQDITEPLVHDKVIHTEQDDAQAMLNLFQDFVPPATALGSKEIIIIDSQVQNYQQLIQGVSPDTRVIILDPSKDGLQQIGELLSQYQDLDAIHIVSHGDSGNLHIGNTSLNLQTLQENDAQIEAWGQALSEDGDIMLYGCDVGKGDEGQMFVHKLSELTDADVAASTDPTGHETLGGDWDLESQTGTIETAIAFSEQTRDEYNHVLADTPAPIGSEFLVNTEISDKQELPSVAALDNGGFVVVWQSLQSEDGSALGVFGQRYDSAGSAVGSEFMVNTYTALDQHRPEVAGLNGGGFVVVWNSNLQDGDLYGIYSRIYTAAGTPATVEIQVNMTTASDQHYPVVAELNSGNFVVAWQSNNQDGDSLGVYGREFNSSGTALTVEFQVNTTTTNSQNSASITALNDGGFLVVWESFSQDGDNAGIFGQRYDSAATTVGGEFQINTYTTSAQNQPQITNLNNGDFVVAWCSNSQDGDSGGIYGQRYDASGAEIGGEFQINTYTTQGQINPQVTRLNDGGFVVVWASYDQDGSFYGTYGQRYDSSGNAFGTEFLVNTTTADSQSHPAIATLENDNFIAVWDSNDQDATGTLGVYGQLFTNNSSPVLDNTGSMTLTTIPKTATDPLGDKIVDIIASAGGDRITDVDSGAVEGIAVTNVDELYVTWWFSTDSGSTWTSMTGASNTGAILLAADASTLVRFIPDGANFGPNNINFRAWDQTAGSNGDTDADTTNNGGNTTFSTATETASVYVDDIPALSSGAVTAYTENDPATVIDSTITLTDDSANMVEANITISANYIEGEDVLSFTPSGNITGIWDAPSATLTLSGTDTIAIYQTALRSVTFESSSDNPGAMGGLSRTISFDVDDGLSTSTVVTSTVNITAVNDAPFADTQPHNEVIYTGSPEMESGISLAEKMAGDVDVDGDPLGIAVVSVDDTNGIWQYTVDGGSTWNNFGGVSDVNATLLAPTTDTRIRFAPNNTSYIGTAAINIRMWDQTAGSHGQTGVDVSMNGGINPYSSDLEIVIFDVQGIPYVPPPPDTSGELPPESDTGNFVESSSEPLMDDRAGDSSLIADVGLISSALEEFTEPSDPPLSLETSLFPPEIFDEAPLEPGPEELAENIDEPLLEELLEEEIPGEEMLVEEPSEEEILETIPEEVITEETAGVPAVDGIIPAADDVLPSSQEPPVKGGLSEQLVREGQKAITEPIQILKIFEEVYELLQCK